MTPVIQADSPQRKQDRQHAMCPNLQLKQRRPANHQPEALQYPLAYQCQQAERSQHVHRELLSKNHHRPQRHVHWLGYSLSQHQSLRRSLYRLGPTHLQSFVSNSRPARQRVRPCPMHLQNSTHYVNRQIKEKRRR